MAWTTILIGVVALPSSAPGAQRGGPAHAAATMPAPTGGGPTVRLTLDVDWSTPGPIGPVAVDLGLTEGRVVGFVPQSAPREFTPDSPIANPARVGHARSGRVRARVEAPLGATFTVQAGGQAVRIPLIRLLDGPQRTVPPATIEVGVARVAWDTVEVDPGESDGVAAPGAEVPVRVGFNVLSIDAAAVNLRYTAELRSVQAGTVAWEHSDRVAVATDVLEPASWILPVRVPAAEGLYTLEVRATWEPAADADGSRLGRFLRRRRPAPAGGSAATRRVSLAVVDPKAGPAAPGTGRAPAEEVVDRIDLSRPRGHRPSASGRSPGGEGAWRMPEAAMVEETRRDRLRGWLPRVDSDPVVLGPGDAAGLAWSAVGLKVARPHRPHRLTVTVTGGHPSALGVGMVATGGAAGRPRVVLDACASGPPLIEGAKPEGFSWLVWPDAPDPVLVLVNRNPSSPVRLGAVTLAELADVPPPPTIAPPGAGPGRVVGVDLVAASALDRFGGGGDPFVAGRNLARYLLHCGATAAVLPEALADRPRRLALGGQGDEDPLGPDRLDLLLRLFERHGLSAWVDLAPDAPLPGLPAPDSDAATAEGVARIDRAGKADGPGYQTLHPQVREALARRVAASASARRSRPSLAGVLIRLGPGSTLLGRPDTGLDDATFARFVAAMFDAGLARGIPGLGPGSADRFEARARFLDGAGQKPWLTWRARELAAVYAELAEAARAAAPGARLAVATPDLQAGPVGDEIRRLDRVGLGPAQAWRSVGLDLAAWPGGESAPIVLRGVGLSADEHARDLATSPELDDPVAARAARGLWLGTSGRAAPSAELALAAPPIPDGAAADEPLGHALAALDGGWFFASADAVAGREERVRRFAQVVRSLPPPGPGPADPRPASGVAARLLRGGEGGTFLALANDTPYPIQLEAVVRCPVGAGFADLGRTAPIHAEPVPGGLRVVADLPPFGVASARLEASEATLGGVIPHPGAAVLDGMKAQHDDLAVTLARINRLASGESGVGPANADFEAAAAGPGVAGWRAVGDPSAAVAIDDDRPHSGRSSLRLDATALPASAVSDPFAAAGHPSVTIHAWLRGDRPETRVRLWLEGQAAGRPFARQLEVTARPGWTNVAVRASGIPDTGLDSARLRFEMIAPGRLWLDDLGVSGATLTEPERLARRDLMAALSAYRDHRYADFARLAGSHWARHVASEAAAPGRLAGDRSGLIRTGDTSPSALPSSRRLR